MKVLIISGFLGSGKTTLINKIVNNYNFDFAVYENECGGMPIDSKVIKNSSGLNVWESTENCICCGGSSDFASSLLTISSSIDPEYLIVEPTGIAKLGSITDMVKKVEYGRITLMTPITVFDCINYKSWNIKYGDILSDQLLYSSVVYCSKADSLSNTEKNEVENFIKDINPNCIITFDDSFFLKNESNNSGNFFSDILRSYSSSTDKTNFINTANNSNNSNAINASKSIPQEIDTFSLKNVRLETQTLLIQFLDDVTRGFYGDISRVKGILSFKSESIKFDLVGYSWAITGYETNSNLNKDPETAITVIGYNINKKKIRNLFIPDLFSFF